MTRRLSLALALFISMAPSGIGTQSSMPALAQKWRVSAYKGLVPGKSKKADVERVLGKPFWKGHPEDEYDNPMERFIEYDYENVGGFGGRTSVIMKRLGGVVTEVSLYPPYEDPLTSKQAIEQHGNEYIEREDGLGPCPTATELRKYRRAVEKQYPVYMVYPQKGLFIVINKGNTVAVITYLASCP